MQNHPFFGWLSIAEIEARVSNISPYNQQIFGRFVGGFLSKLYKLAKSSSIRRRPQVLDKAADVSRRAKNAYIRTKEQARQTQQPEHDSYTEYAEDKIKTGAETGTREAGHSVER